MLSVKKVTLVYLTEDEEEVLKELGKRGVFEPKEIEKEEYPGLEQAPSRKGDYPALIQRLQSLKNDLSGKGKELEQPEREIKEIPYSELERRIEELEEKVTGKEPPVKTKREEVEALEELEQLIEKFPTFKAELESTKLAKKEIKEAKRELERYEAEEGEPKENILKEISYLRAVAKYSDFLAKGRAKTLRGERISLLQGWVPRENLKTFKRFLDSVTEKVEGKISVNVEDPEPGESSPTIMKNPSFLKGHEGLARQYDVPSSHETDPTVLTAALWTLMFGFMFADWGQGLVILILGLTLIRKGGETMGFPSKSLGKLIVGCGLSATFFGLLTGEFFLMEGVPLHPLLPLGEHWATKSTNILWLFKIAVFFGVTQLVLGYVIGIKNSFAEGGMTNALVGEKGLAGLVTFLSIVLLAFKFIALFAAKDGDLDIVPGVIEVQSSGLMWPIVGMIIGLMGILAGSVVEGEGLGLGFGHLIEVLISSLSNMTSYLRLAGFLLFHAALALVVSSMGGGTMGIGFSVLLNALALTLEFMVVGIQALRLLFYEFFSKFFEGGGSVFREYKLPKELREIV